MPVPESRTDGGWFIVNVAGAPAKTNPRKGTWTQFEADEARFEEFGINVTVLQPGQPNGAYHAENMQEDFLVLSGECVAIVEDRERPMRAWDFLHCPPGTRHIFVGAGDGPCAILMVGSRRPDEVLEYPASEVAARYGATATTPTASAEEAYADWPRTEPLERMPWPPPASA
ncbi:MAG: hypothetical protein QOJ07_396 [Thermoleophilaceae bacterium]|nr:hypothetical protein [Thermoleophilaceae bacterium]